MTATVSRTRGYKPTPKNHYSPGTPVYCWRFNHPKFGWCGGADDDMWSDKRQVIESMMGHCQWPTELIEAIA